MKSRSDSRSIEYGDAVPTSGECNPDGAIDRHGETIGSASVGLDEELLLAK